MVRLLNATALILILACGPVHGQEILSKTDRDIYRRAFAAADASDWTAAFSLSRRAENKLPNKVLRWLSMTKAGNEATFHALSGFIAANPDWPLPFSLRRRAEEALTDPDKTDLPPEAVIAWLDRYPPLTSEGRIALLDALDAIGKSERATALARNIWIHSNLKGAPERRLLLRFGGALGAAEHARRLDRLVWDRRWREVRRMLPRVGAARRALARARMRLARMRGGVDGAIRRVPAHLQRDPGLLYERVRWRRRKGRLHDAFEMLAGLPEDLLYAERWWTERVIIARGKLKEGRYLEAFALTSNHGMWPGSASFARAEWLTGWLALRFLDRPAEALMRFERLYATVRFPISRARAAYWAGRAATVLEDPAAAERWYREAARFGATFYGQVAARMIGRADDRSPPPPRGEDPAGRAAFEGSELVRTVRLLDQIGRDKLVALFAGRLARLDPDPRRLLPVVALVRGIGRRDLGVRIARYAYRQGVTIEDAAYPLIDMPRTAIEPALMLAIGRQESNFAVNAISRSGARGIMQLMPGTARATARKIRQRYSRARLTRDAAYNIGLAMSHLGDLLDRYDNHYVPALVAYNAGRRAADRWIRAFGDPRDPDTDLIDWIESVPFPETRNYVQRVLEGLEIYRDRLGTPGPAPWLGAPAMTRDAAGLVAETPAPAGMVDPAP